MRRDRQRIGMTVLTDVPPTFTLPGEPYLEYLPIVDLSTGRLLGMEALVRWNHPTQGLISPDDLLPQAELSGDIGPLTQWVLMEACHQAKQWQDRYGPDVPFTMTVSAWPSPVPLPAAAARSMFTSVTCEGTWPP